LNDRLKAVETQGWRCRVVLTCRTANYDRAQVPWATLTEYELALFHPKEIRQFIEKWFGPGNGRGQTLRQVLDRNFSLSHACHNPLILTLTCLAHEEGEVTDETRRVDLYARVLRGLARRAWKENPLNPQDPHIGDFLRPLPIIAQTLFELRPEGNQFTESEVFEAIKDAPDLPFGPIQFRDELLKRGILVGAGLTRAGEPQFSFLHRTFLEYLTACALEEQRWQAIAEFVDKKAWLPTYQEVIILLTGKLEDPAPLLEKLLNPNPTPSNPHGDDLFRHRLCLAAQCLPELSSVNRQQSSPAQEELQNLTQRIAEDVLNLWWTHQEQDFSLRYINGCLPAIAQSNPASVFPMILERLGDADWMVRWRAAAALGRMGEAVAQQPEVVATLVTCLRDAAAVVRWSAAEALGRIMARGIRVFKGRRGKLTIRSVAELSRTDCG
jgi:hypothetical protein